MKWSKSKVTLPDGVQDKAAGWIAKCIVKLRERWVTAMNRLMARLSPFWLKTVWVCGMFVMFAYCSCLIAFSFGKGNPASLRIGTIRRPLTAINSTNNTSVLPKTDNAILPIIRFQKSLDSLATTPSGSRQRDSLLRMHPGLMDSIREVERLYCQ